MSQTLQLANQAVLLNSAAAWLRALGRLTESPDPMRSSEKICVEQENWSEAAIRASNLSELKLLLGEVSVALSDAERSVTYADRSGDAFQRMTKRVRHADVLHQSGRRSEAESLFREAEHMQAERQSSHPLLYSVRGFQYCDLLLAPAEREASQRSLTLRVEHLTGRLDSESPATEACRAVTDRATQTLKWMEADPNAPLLTLALDHLTLSRAALYESLLSGSAIAPSASPLSAQSSEIEAAVSGLRRAGTTHHLPRALLTRAWQRSLLGRKTGQDSAQSDLDEAWEIASRGPMPLFLADIHLHRARLFGEPTALTAGPDSDPAAMPEASADGSPGYPWVSVEDDLSEARRLIEKHGYGRRMGELEDAETALLPRD
jgi:hypothetical protein